MSIKGLTDRGLSFPQIGNVRKGDKKPENGRAPGKDLTYFRVEFDEREAQSAALFLDKYGNRPTEINFVFPFNEIERCWEAWLEGYTAGRMVARSDGEYFTYLLDDKGEARVIGGLDKDGHKVPHTEIVGKDYKGTPIKVRPVGRLRIVIPELQRLAYLVVHTTSKHDIINLSEQLEGIKTINGGRLVGIPLVLRRRPRMISTPDPSDKSKRARREKWLLYIEADPDWVKAKLLEVKRAALPGNGLALLNQGSNEPPVDEWPDDEDEFFDDYPGDGLTGEIIETDAGQLPEGADYTDADFDPRLLTDTPLDAEVDAGEYEYAMSINLASSETDGDGTPYGDIDSEVLADRLAKIEDALLKPMNAARRENGKRKLAAIQTLLAYRARTTFPA